MLVVFDMINGIIPGGGCRDVCVPSVSLIDPSSIQLTVVITGAHQTIRVNKYFANAFALDRGDGTSSGNYLTGMTKTYATAGTYKITLSLTGGATRWTFILSTTSLPPLVPIS